MATPHNPNQNQLLAALTGTEFTRLLPHLELVPMPLGELHLESGAEIPHVFFPTTSIVSLHYSMGNGAIAEIACVGSEGLLGIPLFVGDSAAHCWSSVSKAGYGYRLKMRLLMEEFSRNGSMRHLLLRYTQALITQTSLVAQCNMHHSVEQRLCRWLMMMLERMPSGNLTFSLEFMSRLFGTGQEHVLEAIRKLEQAGLVNYRGGRFTVPDRKKMEAQACECYNAIKAEFDRLLGLDWDWRPMSESVKTWSRVNTHIAAAYQAAV